MLAATATVAASPGLMRGQVTASSAQRIGYDPNLQAGARVGELWPLTLSASQKVTVAALCDMIIPADDHSPSASAVGIVEFMDEWISAPYPEHAVDRGVVLSLLDWVESEAETRHARRFHELAEEQKTTLLDEICAEAKARPAAKKVAGWFSRYRDLTAGGFYTTPDGRRDLNYIGNMPLATFDGPPEAVLRQADLLDEAKS